VTRSITSLVEMLVHHRFYTFPVKDSMRSYSKKMRPGREVNLLTPRYYVFYLKGETGDSETRHL
jgi:hypothetical protein